MKMIAKHRAVLQLGEYGRKRKMVFMAGVLGDKEF